MGYMSLVAPLGTAFGPALGGYLQAGFGNVILFSAAGALASFGFFCLLPLFNPPLVAQPTSKPVNQFREFWQLLSSPQVRIPAIILLIVGLTIGSVDTFVSLFIKSTGVNLNVGLFFTTAAISAFGVRLFAGRASDKYGRGLVITISLVFYVIDMFCIWSANNSASFLLGACMHGIAGGSTFPTISAMMADRAQPHERGKIFSVALMGFDLGLVSAGPLLGGISEYIGYRSMFGYVVLACILSTYIFLTQSNRNLPESLRFACGLGRDAFTLH
jgi:MFS family permease